LKKSSAEFANEFSNEQQLSEAWKKAGEWWFLTAHICGFSMFPVATSSCSCTYSGECYNPSNPTQKCFPTSTTTPRLDSCLADYTPSLISITVSRSASLVTIPIGSFSSVKIPAGALTIAATNLTIRPVADSRIAKVANILDISRKDMGFNTYFTRASTVLSPVFECLLPANVQTTFTVPFIYTSELDLQRFPDYRDICLGTVKTVTGSFGKYQSWSCVNDQQTGVINQFATGGTSKIPAQATISTCGAGGSGAIYAFIHHPRYEVATLPVYQTNWLSENVVALILSLSVVLALVLCAVFGCCRFYRYRSKLKAKRTETDELQENNVQMQEFGGKTGKKDAEIVLTENPLVARINTDTDKKSMEEIQNDIAVKQDEGEQRSKTLKEQRDDKDSLERELARLKRELATQDTVAESDPRSAAALPSSRREIKQGGKLPDMVPATQSRLQPEQLDGTQNAETPQTLSKAKTLNTLNKKRDM